MKYFTLFFCLLMASNAFAQKTTAFEISGKLIVKSDQTPVENATVYVERVKDSSLVTYTITDQEGNFTLEGKTTDNSLRFYASYVGAQTYSKLVPIGDGLVDLKTIVMDDESSLLNEVVVISRSPIRVKQDTLEFNVGSFKTKKDANVEDLLKRLPGVEIDLSGKITVNGKDVDKLLINGKPFFGDDPTITTRNITKDMIEKVQIMDTRTKAEAFTGQVSESDNKTINLTISKDKNKGVFGRASVAGGTDKRYELAGMVNVFDNDQRLSILGGANNTNSPGFSFGELDKMFGGSGRGGFSGGSGITTSQNSGINYTDDFGKKVEMQADYFFSKSNSYDDNATERENILPDDRYFTSNNSSRNSDSESHRVNMEFEIKIDSTLMVDFEPFFSTSTSSRSTSRDEESRDSNQIITNQSESASTILNEGNRFGNKMSITKRLGRKGGFLSLSINQEINKTTSDNYLNSQTEIFGDTPESLSRIQFTDGEEKANRFSTFLKFRQPIMGKIISMDFTYNFRNDTQEDIKSTYDFNNGTNNYDLFNEALSTNFENKNIRSIPGLRFNFRNKKISANLGVSYIFRTLENIDELRPEFSLKRNFEAVESSARIRYSFNPKSNLQIRYSLRNDSPSLRQLNPFVNVSNPLNTIVGNPNLEPTTSHNIRASFSNFNFQKKSGLYFQFQSNFDKNSVVSKTEIDENFVRNTTYTNVDGAYNISLGGGYNKDLKLDSVKTLKVELGLWSSINESINFSNGEKYNATNNAISPNLGLTFSWNDVMEIRPNYRISFTENKFDLPQFNSRKFARHTIGIITSTMWPKRLEWRNDLNYNYNPQIADGFQKSTWFWNSGITYSIMKDNGLIGIKAYDLLNQNNNSERFATNNYIQDSQSTVLQRYFMFSFSWKFNSLGNGAEMNRDGRSRGRRRGYQHNYRS
ncbi:outer membrane beta-barrel protein [Flavobacteriaceae bacterium F08102]|nr:outer membrane beta-barrel protein [Flavobacteriaceae bacterium F08102]